MESPMSNAKSSTRKYTLRTALIPDSEAGDWWDWGIYNRGRLICAGVEHGHSYNSKSDARQAGEVELAELLQWERIAR